MSTDTIVEKETVDTENGIECHTENTVAVGDMSEICRKSVGEKCRR